MEYLILKLLHIVSSTILFGTGLGTAFFMVRANLSNDINIAFIEFVSGSLIVFAMV